MVFEAPASFTVATQFEDIKEAPLILFIGINRGIGVCVGFIIPSKNKVCNIVLQLKREMRICAANASQSLLSRRHWS